MKQSVISEPHFWEDDINVDDAFVIIACDGLVFFDFFPVYILLLYVYLLQCVLLYRLLWYGFVIILYIIVNNNDNNNNNGIIVQ